MTSNAVAHTPAITSTVDLDLIDVGENVRELDPDHVEVLASSIALRGLLVPIILRPVDERFVLIAGHHRVAACRSLGFDSIAYTLREQDGSSADSAAENIMRKQLTPLEEAQAVKKILDEGFTAEGAAGALGFSPKLVNARLKILALPEIAQKLIGSGDLPVSSIAVLEKIAQASTDVCEAAVQLVANREASATQLTQGPSRLLGQRLRGSKVFCCQLERADERDIRELRLGKKADALLTEAMEIHKQLNPYVYGQSAIGFAEQEVDQARAAGVLIEFEDGAPLITDRAIYRELVKQALLRTVEELRSAKNADDAKRAANRNAAKTPTQLIEAEHRANIRGFAAQAHGTNLDLGSALIQNLAAVDPGDMDVARFFAYGLLGPEGRGYLASRDHLATTLAANGIRLVIEQHRTTTRAKLKAGGWGKTKVSYNEVEDALAWLWKFVDGAKNAGELYGRVMVVFATQHYAEQLVLAQSKRRNSALPSSHKNTARKAFERVAKRALPGSHLQLERALEREAREHNKKLGASRAPATPTKAPSSQAERATNAEEMPSGG